MGQIYRKYVSDTKRATFDYTGLLAPGDTLSLTAGAAPITSSTGDPGGTAALTVGTVTITSTAATALVSGGVAGSSYLLTCQATTVNGESVRINAPILIRANTDV